VEDRTCASPFAFDIGATTVADHILLLQAAQASGSKPPPMWFINSIMDNGFVCCTQTAQWLHFILLRSSPSSILYASTLTIPTTTSLLLRSHFPHHIHSTPSGHSTCISCYHMYLLFILVATVILGMRIIRR
jgi:hypothetical protein